jgi:hypothetical protein
LGVQREDLDQEMKESGQKKKCFKNMNEEDNDWRMKPDGMKREMTDRRQVA